MAAVGLDLIWFQSLLGFAVVGGFSEAMARVVYGGGGAQEQWWCCWQLGMVLVVDLGFEAVRRFRCSGVGGRCGGG
ncbi:hypothetical protein RHGRI_037353 [Rhododendron griersonianum]|uniref:Uncharacterized protein n=1 Tax=Rhododendron griersonianum TaxID=479676 RepID=A0AAV6HSH6_9ERIC|nr:hypothetical protein RHGRI_037353 [Rhododendron griersonianum]